MRGTFYHQDSRFSGCSGSNIINHQCNVLLDGGMQTFHNHKLHLSSTNCPSWPFKAACGVGSVPNCSETVASTKPLLSQVLFSFLDLCAWETHPMCPLMYVFLRSPSVATQTLRDAFLNPPPPPPPLPPPPLVRRGRVPDGRLCRPVSEHSRELPVLLRRPRRHEAEPGPPEL